MNKVIHLTSLVVIIFLISCTASDEDVRSRNIEAVQIVFSEIWSKGNVELIGDVYADSFIGHFPAGPVSGLEELQDRVIAHRTSFPDWTEIVEDIIVDGDKIVIRFTSSGTNLGNFLGNLPTGNHIKISEVAIFRFYEGKIIEQWVYPNMLSMQRQLLRQPQQ